MLRFFRQIRQRLLTGNPPDQGSRAGKFSKYLLLVVRQVLLVEIVTGAGDITNFAKEYWDARIHGVRS